MRSAKMLVILVLDLMVFLAMVGKAAPMGTVFTYQGRLMDANQPADGLYDFEFRLFDDPCTGIQQGSTIDVNEADVIDGYFTVELDFGSGVFTGDARWLEIGVRLGDSGGGFTTLNPRQEVTPTPYAIYALNGPVGTGWATNGSHIYNTNSGNVGIGTSSPVWKLEVANPRAAGWVESGVSADDSGGAMAAYSSTFPAPFTHFADRVSLFSNVFTATGLDLRADGSTSDIRFYTGGFDTSNERMRITDDGYLGIGTTSPELKLAVEDGGININSLLDDGAGRWSRGLVFTNNSNGMGPWTHAAIWADGVAGFNGELVFGVDGDDKNNMWSLSDPQIQEAMRIDKSGNLGIGTSNPGTNLHVSYSDSGHTPANVGGLFVESGGISNSSYVFQTATTGGGKSFSITNAGNVGIGTTNPGAKLDVNGDLRVTGAYKGNIGPNNGAPFPRPAYDSGWTSISKNQVITFNHGIGGNADDYFVDLCFESTMYGRHHKRYGGYTYSDAFMGAYWSQLTNTQIKVHRFGDDVDIEQVRVRIWVYN